MVEISKDSKLPSSNNLDDIEDWETDYCYLRFEEDDLFKALVTDDRFEIENDESVEDSVVRVRR